MKKYLKALVEKINEDEGTLDVAIASDNSIDRDGEIIDPDGMSFKDFKKNPVLLWAHDYRSEPIGKVVSIKKEGNKILFKPKFAIDIDPKARKIFEFFKQGYLNAFSIGFQPKEAEMQDKKGNSVRVFTKSELLEISAVPVPANPNALVMARSCKSIDKDTLGEVEKLANKSVVPYKDLGVVQNLDADWDGAKEITAVGEDLKKLKEISTWYDKDKSDSKSSYKLPHHQSSDSKAVWRGVAAAMAALLGARGGVKLPESDRKGVYNHLAKHYKQFDKKAPEFKLVEAQVLKDVDLETDAPIVVNIIQADKKELKNLKKDIDNIKNVLSGANGEGSEHKGSDKRSVLRELNLDPKKLKRVLQVVNNSTSEALRAIKQADDHK